MEINHILVPTDFSADAEDAFHQAIVLAARENAHVLLLHVLSRGGIMCPEAGVAAHAQLVQELQTEVEQRLAAAAAVQPWPVETLAVWGNPVVEICRIAKAYGTDLIVMSPPRRNGLVSLFFGSVTEQVVHYAPCSVLILRTCQPRTARVNQWSALRYFQPYSTRKPSTVGYV